MVSTLPGAVAGSVETTGRFVLRRAITVTAGFCAGRGRCALAECGGQAARLTGATAGSLAADPVRAESASALGRAGARLPDRAVVRRTHDRDGVGCHISRLAAGVSGLGR